MFYNTLCVCQRFEVKADDLIQLKERGRGAYGVVYEMRHQETGTIMAVKVLLILLSCDQYKIELKIT